MFLRYLNFRIDFFYYNGKQLNEKAKVNFKIYEVTDWTADNIDTHIILIHTYIKGNQNCLAVIIM